MLGQTDCTTSTFTASDSPNDLKVGFKLSESLKRGAYMSYMCYVIKGELDLTGLNCVRVCARVHVFASVCTGWVMSNRVTYWLSS